MTIANTQSVFRVTLGAIVGAFVVTVLCLPAFPQSNVETPETERAMKSTFPEPRESVGANEYKVHLGLEMGYAEPGEKFDAGTEYGVNVGFQPAIPFGLGAEVSTFRAPQDTTGVNFDRTKVMVNGTYNFGGPYPVLRNAYMGVGLGPVVDTMGDFSDTYLGVNLLTGADFPITRDSIGRKVFSLGGVAKYLIVTEDVQDSFALNAQLKYWF